MLSFEEKKERENAISTFEEFKAFCIEVDGFINLNLILDNIPLVIPKEAKEYTARFGLWSSNSVDWIHALNRIKKQTSNSDERFKELAGWFEDTFRSRKDSVQTCKLVNPQKGLASEIHILISRSGYRVVPYFNEGRKLTVQEKIEGYRKNLEEKCPLILQDIQEHFKEENIKSVLLVRGGNLRRSRPKDNQKRTFDGLDYYIWRMTSFNIGNNVSLPVMASFEIRSYFKEKFGLKDSYFGSNENHVLKHVIQFLDLIIDLMNKEMFGKQSYSGAMIWAKALGIPM